MLDGSEGKDNLHSLRRSLTYSGISCAWLFAMAVPVSAAVRTWTGGAGSSNWNVAGNWSGNAIPGSGDTAQFDATSSSDCTFKANVSIAGLIIASDYGGTLSQGSGASLTVGGSGISIAGGTLHGSDAPIDCNGALTMTGGSFRATSGTLYVFKNLTISGGTFAHNGGCVRLDGWDKSVNVGGAVLNDLIYDVGGNSVTVSGTIVLDGNLTIQSVNYMNGGTIRVRGNVTSNDTAIIGYPGTILMFDQAGDQSLIAGTADAQVPSVTIDKPSGTLTIHGPIGVFNHWTHLSGAVDCGAQPLKFVGYDKTIAAGTMSYGSVLFSTGGNSITINGTMDVNGDLTIQSVNYLSGGVITVAGNVLTTDTSVNGYPAATIRFDGIGDQSLSAGGAYGMVPSIDIDKASGKLTISDQIGVHKDWKHTRGDVDASGSIVRFVAFDKTIDAQGMAFNDVEIATGGNSVTVVGSMRVGGSFLLNSVNYFQGGSIFIAGDVTTNATSLQSYNAVTLVLDGEADQLITAGVNARFPKSITINKTRCTGGAARLASDLRLNQSGQNLTVVEGRLDLKGFSLEVKGSSGKFVIQDGGILECESGATLTTNLSYPELQCGSMVVVADVASYAFPGNTASDLSGTCGNSSWFASVGCAASSTPVACTATSTRPRVVQWREVKR